LVKETGANASAIFVPPAFAADAVLEAADSNLSTIVCLTEGIPTIEMVTVKKVIREKGLKLVALKMLQMDEALGRRHYAPHVNKAFFPELLEPDLVAIYVLPLDNEHNCI
jgi:hypothetical protein